MFSQTMQGLLKVNLKATGIIANDKLITNAPPLNEFLSMLVTTDYREEELLNDAKPWRKFVIFDDLGLSLLYDYEIKRVIQITFHLGLSKSPQCPKAPFSGLLFVGDRRLVAGMKEPLLPLKGEFHFVKRGGWDARSKTLFVHLVLRAKKLHRVSALFLK